MVPLFPTVRANWKKINVKMSCFPKYSASFHQHFYDDLERGVNVVHGTFMVHSSCLQPWKELFMVKGNVPGWIVVHPDNYVFHLGTLPSTMKSSSLLILFVKKHVNWTDFDVKIYFASRNLMLLFIKAYPKDLKDFFLIIRHVEFVYYSSQVVFLWSWKAFLEQ